MRSRSHSGARRCASIAFALCSVLPYSAHAQSKAEEIEWTWEVRPPHAEASLPNVLLEGDSITRNYFPEVQRELAGKANVYLMASSICAADPRLPEEIRQFAKLEGVHFQVVHFNNGMHGFAYSEAQYKAGFPGYIEALRSIMQDGTLIWATTTPVKMDTSPGPTNARIDARNAIALAFVDNMSIDDQHALMEKHQDQYADTVHFDPYASNLSGAQASRIILQALDKR